MAKMLFSGIGIVDIRNKINGTVFSKNRYGAYARTKVTPVNPQTDAQQAARNNLSTWSQAWRGLTENERQSWIDGAPNFPFTDIFGNSKVLSGQALYVKLNVNLQNVLGTPLTACPTPVALPAISLLTVAADDSANTVIATFNPTPVAADFAIQFYATPNVTPGKSFVKNLFRLTTYVGAGTTSPSDISGAYRAIFGDPVAGNKIFIKAVMISVLTGQQGIPLQASTIVVP